MASRIDNRAGGHAADTHRARQNRAFQRRLERLHPDWKIVAVLRAALAGCGKTENFVVRTSI
jgi:hypothetical protein